MQAKDLPDADVLAVIHRLETDGQYGDKRRWVMRGEVEAAFPDAPWKVVLAKCRSLIKRGLIGGCPCGCRGDFYTKDDEGTGCGNEHRGGIACVGWGRRPNCGAGRH